MLEAGREAFGRRAWRDAYTRLAEADRITPLGLDDLERLATAGHLIGADGYADLWTRAHHNGLRDGDAVRAARAAFWLAYGLLTSGQIAAGSGWLARAERLLDERGADCVERGYLLVPLAIARFDEDPAAALDGFVAAGRVGERFADPGLVALSQMGQGQSLIALGRWAEAVRLLDEAMVAVAADELPPIVAGSVFCGVIDACQGILDVRRTREWTAALSRWCDAQPDLLLFRGECLVHRAEVMQLRGDWQDAADEAERAGDLLAGRPVRGEALYRSAELHRLRGELAEAEEGYRAASVAGREPQPGLALLRLAQGQTDTAVATIRRVLGEAGRATVRAGLLGAYVEIVLAAGDVESARHAADELGTLAAAIDGPYLRAAAAGASGAVLLADGKPVAALPPLRQAWAGWRGLEIPYEAARVRVLIGLACRTMDDRDGGDMELDAARLGFQSLGATVDMARVEALLTAKPDLPGGLTGREREVLALVAKGSTNREIAAALVISEHTVARHMQNILGKLGLPSRTAASAFAYEHGLV